GQLFFLDAVLFDLSKLPQREQNRVFTLFGLCHGRPQDSASHAGLSISITQDLAQQRDVVPPAAPRYTRHPRWATSISTATCCSALTTARPIDRPRSRCSTRSPRSA